MAAENGQSETPSEARLIALERWRDAVDDERGTIMRELGEFKGLLSGIRDQVSGQMMLLSQQLSSQIGLVNGRLDSIEDKLDERPSQAEIQKMESALSRGIESVRAKAKELKTPLSELEVKFGKNSFKLLGFSGVTIILAMTLLITLAALWLLTKK